MHPLVNGTTLFSPFRLIFRVSYHPRILCLYGTQFSSFSSLWRCSTSSSTTEFRTAFLLEFLFRSSLTLFFPVSPTCTACRTFLHFFCLTGKSEALYPGTCLPRDLDQVPLCSSKCRQKFLWRHSSTYTEYWHRGNVREIFSISLCWALRGVPVKKMALASGVAVPRRKLLYALKENAILTQPRN